MSNFLRFLLFNFLIKWPLSLQVKVAKTVEVWALAVWMSTPSKLRLDEGAADALECLEYSMTNASSD